MLRGVIRLSCLVLLPLSLASCGSDGNDQPDPVALLVALLENPPGDLPDDVTVDGEPESISGGAGEEIGGVEFFMHGSGVEHWATLVLHRDEDAARETFDEELAFYEFNGPEDDSGIVCDYDGDTIDVLCIGHDGLVYIELSSFPTEDEDPDPDELRSSAEEVFEAVVDHVREQADDARDRVDPVPRPALAVLLQSVPPPDAPDGAAFTDPFKVAEDDELLQQFDHFSFGWDAGTDWKASFSLFPEHDDARTYHDRFLGSGTVVTDEDHDATCYRGEDDDDNPHWVCLRILDDAVLFAQHATDSEDLDGDTLEFLDSLVEHVTGVRSGELPPAREGNDDDRADPTPTATEVPPTATPPPQISVVNAGTWDLNATVQSNDCPGGDPAVGSQIALQYVFTESGSDELLTEGEFIRIEQTAPGYRDFGVFSMTLPTLSINLPVTAGTFTGTGELTIDFIAVDLAHLHYVEDYDVCRIVADSRTANTDLR
jgi:hypothetical protein